MQLAGLLKKEYTVSAGVRGTSQDLDALGVNVVTGRLPCKTR